MNDESTGTSQQKKSVFKNWTSDDGKLLIITIVATVIANVITVVIVALAVIIARSNLPHPGTPGNYAFFFGTAIFPITYIFVAVPFLRHSRRKKNTDSTIRVIRWVIVAIGVFQGFYLMLIILALLGLAVGIN